MNNRHLKQSFFIAFVLLNITLSKANTYYFSSSKGSDNHSQLQAQNQLTPWKSIAKLNAMMPQFESGDKFLFLRGDVFSGTINIGISGTEKNPVLFSTYGNGNQKPIIEGLLSLVNWEKVGTNIWEVSNKELKSQPSALMVNNVLQPLGRFPNINAPNRGYLTIDAHTQDSKKEFTCNALSGSTDWTGAEVVLRADHWILNRISIAKQNGNTLTLSNDAKKIKDKFGFFIQNHPATLDTNGEWCFIASNNKIQLYSIENPNLLTIKVANIDNCFYVGNQTYTVIDGFSLIGSKTSAVKLNKASFCSIKNCDFVASGTKDISFGGHSNLNSDNISILNNTFTNTQSNCIDVFGKKIIISNNRFKNIATIPGMGESGQTGFGINVVSDSLQIERNTMDSIGYVPINFLWSSNVLVKENVITNFCTVIDDGAGIYCWMNDKDAAPFNRKVINNIVLYGLGSPAGTDGTYAPAEGIYLDDRSPDVEVIGNTVGYCSNAGIYMHNSPNCTVKNNTVFACDKALWIKHDNIASTIIENCTIENNTLVSNDVSGKNPWLSYQIKDVAEMAKLGVMNNNTFCQPFNASETVNYTVSTPEKLNKTFTLKQWKDYSGYDMNSKLLEMKYLPFNRGDAANMIKNGIFTTDLSGWVKWNAEGNTTEINCEKGKLDDNCLTIKMSGTGSKNSANIRTSIPAITAGKTYLMKMSMFGDNAGSLSCFLVASNSPYKVASAYRSLNIKTTREEKELVFTATESSLSPSFYLAFSPELGSFYVDNVELYEVTPTKSAECIRFETNPTSEVKTLEADKNYISVGGVKYDKGSSISIPAFGSLVLLKK